jgi:hypothetical protein
MIKYLHAYIGSLPRVFLFLYLPGNVSSLYKIKYELFHIHVKLKYINPFSPTQPKNNFTSPLADYKK